MANVEKAEHLLKKAKDCFLEVGMRFLGVGMLQLK
ncbi:hypothetical protein Tco_0234325, partial [Tanacetum coccineum]